MKFSIIITCYNKEKFIIRCIRSSLSQLNIGRALYEVIVVDDCSTDNSLKKILKFRNAIKIIRNKTNMGLSSARNEGIRKSTGKYVMMLDGDDYISQYYLHFMGGFLDFNSSWKAVSCDYIKVFEKKNLKKRFYFKKNPIACGILFRKKTLMKVGLYNNTYRAMEDEEFRKRFLIKNIIYNVELPLYRYVIHEKNLTNNKKIMDKYKRKLIFDDNKKFWKSKVI